MRPEFLDPVVFEGIKYRFGYVMLGFMCCFDWDTMQPSYLPYVCDENNVKYTWRNYEKH